MTGRLLVSLLLVAAASAQIDHGPLQTASRVRIRVTLPDRAPCTTSTRVTLIGNMGFSLAETSANGECIATFFDVPSGRYRVALSGDVVNTDAGEIEVTSLQDVEVRARHTADPANSFPGLPTFVSAADLHVPSTAAKEFGKANQMIARAEWSKAADRLHKAVTLYPSYAAAYNNLGAVYSRLGDTADARSALQEAIALDDHLAAAYVNLARLDFAEKNFADAESLLNKESSLAAPSADELNLLAYSEMMNQHGDQAIETSRHAHAAQLSHHAFLHLIAAHVYELKARITESVAELQTYLREEPAATRAEEIKKAIATLQAQIPNSNPTPGPS
jgi:tetratricopeptide (TPR) repeat protein